MKDNIFSKIHSINERALTLHRSSQEASRYTFSSLQEHLKEVKMLLEQQQDHWKAETVDIVIHALMLLERYGVDEKEWDDLLQQRCGRFADKINTAIQERMKKE